MERYMGSALVHVAVEKLLGVKPDVHLATNHALSKNALDLGAI